MGALIRPFSSMNLCDAAAACDLALLAWAIDFRLAAPTCSLGHSESGLSILF
jgi:hypothetical protein